MLFNLGLTTATSPGMRFPATFMDAFNKVIFSQPYASHNGLLKNADEQSTQEPRLAESKIHQRKLSQKPFAYLLDGMPFYGMNGGLWKKSDIRMDSHSPMVRTFSDAAHVVWSDFQRNLYLYTPPAINTFPDYLNIAPLPEDSGHQIEISVPTLNDESLLDTYNFDGVLRLRYRDKQSVTTSYILQQEYALLTLSAISNRDRVTDTFLQTLPRDHNLLPNTPLATVTLPISNLKDGLDNRNDLPLKLMWDDHVGVDSQDDSSRIKEVLTPMEGQTRKAVDNDRTSIAKSPEASELWKTIAVDDPLVNLTVSNSQDISPPKLKTKVCSGWEIADASRTLEAYQRPRPAEPGPKVTLADELNDFAASNDSISQSETPFLEESARLEGERKAFTATSQLTDPSGERPTLEVSTSNQNLQQSLDVKIFPGSLEDFLGAEMLEQVASKLNEEIPEEIPSSLVFFDSAYDREGETAISKLPLPLISTGNHQVHSSHNGYSSSGHRRSTTQKGELAVSLLRFVRPLLSSQRKRNSSQPPSVDSAPSRVLLAPIPAAPITSWFSRSPIPSLH